MLELPKDSATARALEPYVEWDHRAELLAQVVDGLSVLTWVFVRANVKRGTHVPDPPLVKRPAELEAAQQPPRMATKEEIAGFFAGAGGTVRYSPKARSN